jgi:DNA-binding transcriptional LysR family regulator
LRARYPLLLVSTFQGVSGNVLNQVRKKELDAGFFIGKNPYQNVHTDWLDDFRFAVVAPVAWRTFLEGTDWRMLGRHPWVAASQFSMLSKLQAELWREHNIAPKKVFDIDQEQTMLACVEAGLGLCVLRQASAEAAAAAGRLWIWGDTGVTLPLTFIYPAERAEDALLGALRETLQMAWEAGSGGEHHEQKPV